MLDFIIGGNLIVIFFKFEFRNSTNMDNKDISLLIAKYLEFRDRMRFKLTSRTLYFRIGFNIIFPLPDIHSCCKNKSIYEHEDSHINLAIASSIKDSINEFSREGFKLCLDCYCLSRDIYKCKFRSSKKCRHI